MIIGIEIDIVEIQIIKKTVNIYVKKFNLDVFNK